MTITDFVAQVRTDFQIPSFVSDDTLTRYVNEGVAYFTGLIVSVPSYDTDLEYCSLLSNYVYYAYNHVLNEFFENYQSMIRKWQWEKEETYSDFITDVYAEESSDTATESEA